MNELQRALYRLLTSILVAERLPNGRPLGPGEWWLTLKIAEEILYDPRRPQ